MDSRFCGNEKGLRRPEKGRFRGRLGVGGERWVCWDLGGF